MAPFYPYVLKNNFHKNITLANRKINVGKIQHISRKWNQIYNSIIFTTHVSFKSKWQLLFVIFVEIIFRLDTFSTTLRSSRLCSYDVVGHDSLWITWENFLWKQVFKNYKIKTETHQSKPQIYASGLNP
jgi:carbon starvation protein CstA